MAYLKGGSYVDGDLYIDGTIKVRNIDILGGNSTVTLFEGVSSVRKNSLLKFATDPEDPLAGAVEYSSIYVEDRGGDTLEVTFGIYPGEKQGVYINHPVTDIRICMDSHYNNTTVTYGLILDPANREWSYGAV